MGKQKEDPEAALRTAALAIAGRVTDEIARGQVSRVGSGVADTTAGGAATAIDGEAKAQLAALLKAYRSRVAPAAVARVVVETGEALMDGREWEAATAECFRRVGGLLAAAPPEGAAGPSQLETLELEVRAAYGCAVCSFQAAVARDAQLTAPSTVDTLLAALTAIQTALEKLLAAPSALREPLYWLAYNGAVFLFQICEPLLLFGFPAKVVPFLNFTVLTMAALPHLQTLQFLTFRLRLYTTLCHAFEDMGNQTSAGAVVSAGLAAVAQLQAEQEQDPPVPANVMEVLTGARRQLQALQLRYTSATELPTAIENLSKTPGAPPSWFTGVLVQALVMPGRRVLQHAAPKEQDLSRVNALMTALTGRLAPFLSSLTHAVAHDQVMAWLASPDASIMTFEHHLAAVRVMFNFEKFTEFQALLLTAQARAAALLAALQVDVAAAAAAAAATSTTTTGTTTMMGSAAGSAAASRHMTPDAAAILTATITSTLRPDGTLTRRAKAAPDSAAVELAKQCKTLLLQQQQLLVLRAMYELEFQPIKEIERPDTASSDHRGVRIAFAEEVDTTHHAASTAAANVAGVPGDALERAAAAVVACSHGALVDACTTFPDVLADAVVELFRHGESLVAWLDARQVGPGPGQHTIRAVRSTAIVVLRAVHATATRLALDDARLRATAALRLGNLLCVVREHREAVQVLRQGLAAVSAARDNLLRFDLNVPTRPDDVRALSHAAASCFVDLPTASVLAKRAGVGAYGGTGVFGAGSQVWMSEQELACVQSDMIAAVFNAELAASAVLAQRVARRQQQVRQAAADAANAHAPQTSKAPGAKPRAGGAAGASGTIGGTVTLTATIGTKTGAAVTAAAGTSGAAAGASPLVMPTAATEARLLSECGRNQQWKAILYMQMIRYRRHDAAALRDLLQDCTRAMTAADQESQDLLARISAAYERAVAVAATVETKEASSLDGASATAPAPPASARQPLSARTPAASATASAAIGTGSSDAPIFLSRGSTFIAVRPVRTAPVLPDASAAMLSARTTARPGPAAPAFFVLFGKPTGAGTAVAATSTGLCGTGVPCSSALLKPGHSNTHLAADDSNANAVFATATGLTPNESYVFATAAFDAAGSMVGALSATCAPIIAAAPLPSMYLWAQLAMTASKYGFRHMSTRAASVVAARWVQVGPQSAVWLRSPVDTLALRREELARTPRPLLYALVRSLFILAEIGSGDPAAAILNKTRSTEAETTDGAPTSSHVATQLAGMRRIRTALMGLEAAAVVRDPALIQQGVCGVYTMAIPMLRWRFRGPFLLQALLTSHQCMQLLPPSAWHDKAADCFARLVKAMLDVARDAVEPRVVDSALLLLGPGTGPVSKAAPRDADAAAAAAAGGGAPTGLPAAWDHEIQSPPQIAAYVYDPVEPHVSIAAGPSAAVRLPTAAVAVLLAAARFGTKNMKADDVLRVTGGNRPTDAQDATEAVTVESLLAAWQTVHTAGAAGLASLTSSFATQEGWLSLANAAASHLLQASSLQGKPAVGQQVADWLQTVLAASKASPPDAMAADVFRCDQVREIVKQDLLLERAADARRRAAMTVDSEQPSDGDSGAGDDEEPQPATAAAVPAPAESAPGAAADQVAAAPPSWHVFFAIRTAPASTRRFLAQLACASLLAGQGRFFQLASLAEAAGRKVSGEGPAADLPTRITLLNGATLAPPAASVVPEALVPELQNVLAAAAQAAVLARGAAAWRLVSNAGKLMWNALWAGWVAPSAFVADAPLDWAQPLRTAMALLDMCEAIGTDGGFETVWGTGVGWTAPDSSADQAGDDGEEYPVSEDPGSRDERGMADDVDMSPLEVSKAGRLPKGMIADELTWIASFVAYVCAALSFSGQWQFAVDLGWRLHTVFPQHLLEAEHPGLAPAPMPESPRPPVAGQPPPTEEPNPAADTLAAVEDTNERLYHTVPPVSSLAADSTIGATLPVMSYAAKQLLTAAESQMHVADQELREFEAAYHERVAEINKKKKRTKAAVMETQRRLEEEERAFMEGKGRLGSILSRLQQQVATLRHQLERVDHHLKCRQRDMTQTRSALDASRALLAKYVFSQSSDLVAESVVSLDTLLASYQRTIHMLRVKQDRTLLAQALHELAMVQLSVGGDRARAAAVRTLLDGVDACFGRLNAADDWLDVLNTLGADPLKALGLMGTVLPGVLLARLARHGAGGNQDRSTAWLRFGASLLAAPFSASLQHPARPIDFATYRPQEFVPSADLLADNLALTAGQLVMALRSCIVGLLQYDETFVEHTLPLIAAYEFVAVHRLNSVQRTVDARLLRTQALIIAGQFTAASATLACLLRGDDLPHYSAPLTSETGPALPELTAFQQHVAPRHAANRAALQWLTNWALVLPPAVRVLCGSLTDARMVLLRAELVTKIAATPFMAVPAPQDSEWSVYATVNATAPADVVNSADITGFGGANLAASLIDITIPAVQALRATLTGEPAPAPVPAAAPAPAPAKGAKAAAAAPPAAAPAVPPAPTMGAPVIPTPIVLSPEALQVLAACHCLLGQLEAARGGYKPATELFAAAMAHLAAATAAEENNPAVSVNELTASEAEGSTPLGLGLGVPFWLRCRLLMVKALMSRNAVRSAVAQCEAALREAREHHDTIMGRRLLVARAEVALHQGDINNARTALDIVAGQNRATMLDSCTLACALITRVLVGRAASAQSAVVQANDPYSSPDTAVAALRAACEMLLARASALGMRHDRVRARVAPTAYLDNVYLPHTHSLADAQLLLARAIVDAAVHQRSAGALIDARKEAVAILEHAHSNLRFCAVPSPFARAAVLLRLGQLRSQLLSTQLPVASKQFWGGPSAGTADDEAIFPPEHPFSLTLRCLRVGVDIAMSSAGCWFEGMKLGLVELALLFGAGLVSGAEVRHMQLAVFYLRQACTVDVTNHNLHFNTETLSATKLVTLEGLPSAVVVELKAQSVAAAAVATKELAVARGVAVEQITDPVAPKDPLVSKNVLQQQLSMLADVRVLPSPLQSDGISALQSCIGMATTRQALLLQLHGYLQTALPPYKDTCCLALPPKPPATLPTIASGQVCVQWQLSETAASSAGDSILSMVYMLGQVDGTPFNQPALKLKSVPHSQVFACHQQFATVFYKLSAMALLTGGDDPDVAAAVKASVEASFDQALRDLWQILRGSDAGYTPLPCQPAIVGAMAALTKCTEGVEFTGADACKWLWACSE